MKLYHLDWEAAGNHSRDLLITIISPTAAVSEARVPSRATKPSMH